MNKTSVDLRLLCRALGDGYTCEPGRVRRKGGGCKRKLDQHPEWIDTFKRVVGPHTAGLPQDEDVICTALSFKK